MTIPGLQPLMSRKHFSRVLFIRVPKNHSPSSPTLPTAPKPTRTFNNCCSGASASYTAHILPRRRINRLLRASHSSLPSALSYYDSLRRGVEVGSEGVLVGRTGVLRSASQVAGSASSSNGNNSARSSFHEDCSVVEECNALINARLDIPALKARLAELDEMVADPKLYDDSLKAGKIVKERSMVEAKLNTVERLTSELQSWKEMHEMAVLEGEEELLSECSEKVGLLRKEAERARAETLLALGGDLSSSNCYLELQAGAGGTESHDWTNMLLKMYTRWAEKRGFSVSTVNSSAGDEAGLRGATVLIKGMSAYGWLRMEAGVHRLVRNSPYDPGQRRHTSFAQVRIFPEADGGGEGGAAAVEIPAKDIKIDTMRAQGAGGQHVNTTDSAVRITHLPTGLVAASQSDRSQHRNKDTAMRVLRAKIFQRDEEERHAKRNQYAAGLGENAFGNQIRSYVLSPYQLVKDHRTGKQDGDVSAVLGGELDDFIEAALIAEHMAGRVGAGSCDE